MTLPLPVMTMEDVRAPPIALGAPSLDVPAATVGFIELPVFGLCLSSSLASSRVNSEGAFATVPFAACFCSFLGLSAIASSTEPLLPALLRVSLLLLTLLPLPLLDELAALLEVDVTAETRAGAVCENRHGLRLHGPPGLLADSSGHRTEAKRPSVGNIGYRHGWVGRHQACSGI